MPIESSLKQLIEQEKNELKTVRSTCKMKIQFSMIYGILIGKIKLSIGFTTQVSQNPISLKWVFRSPLLIAYCHTSNQIINNIILQSQDLKFKIIYFLDFDEYWDIELVC